MPADGRKRHHLLSAGAKNPTNHPNLIKPPALPPPLYGEHRRGRSLGSDPCRDAISNADGGGGAAVLEGKWPCFLRK